MLLFSSPKETLHPSDSNFMFPFKNNFAGLVSPPTVGPGEPGLCITHLACSRYTVFLNLEHHVFTFPFITMCYVWGCPQHGAHAEVTEQLVRVDLPLSSSCGLKGLDSAGQAWQTAPCPLLGMHS